MHEPITFPWQMGGAMKPNVNKNLCGTLVKNQTQAVAHSFAFDADQSTNPKATHQYSVEHTPPLIKARPACVATNFEPRCVRTHGGQPQVEKVHCLKSSAGQGDGAPCVQAGMAVRRLTPRECERLQGFPDDWTLIPYRKKPAEDCPDGPRYKALGNSMAVPVMRWIGQRLAQVEAIQ